MNSSSWQRSSSFETVPSYYTTLDLSNMRNPSFNDPTVINNDEDYPVEIDQDDSSSTAWGNDVVSDEEIEDREETANDCDCHSFEDLSESSGLLIIPAMRKRHDSVELESLSQSFGGATIAVPKLSLPDSLPSHLTSLHDQLFIRTEQEGKVDQGSSQTSKSLASSSSSELSRIHRQQYLLLTAVLFFWTLTLAGQHVYYQSLKMHYQKVEQTVIQHLEANNNNTQKKNCSAKILPSDSQTCHLEVSPSRFSDASTGHELESKTIRLEEEIRLLKEQVLRQHENQLQSENSDALNFNQMCPSSGVVKSTREAVKENKAQLLMKTARRPMKRRSRYWRRNRVDGRFPVTLNAKATTMDPEKRAPAHTNTIPQETNQSRSRFGQVVRTLVKGVVLASVAAVVTSFLLSDDQSTSSDE